MAAFPPRFLDEIRSRVPVSEVVGKRVKLTKKGREFSGLCPFHNEKTPSFTVNDDKEFYHCFGCGAHGDVIRYLVEAENYTFPEAVIELASAAGLPVPEYDLEDDHHKAEANERLYAVMEAAAQFYSHQLTLAPASHVRDYLSRRGVEKTLVDTFGLGYALPRGAQLQDYLTQQGFSRDDTIDAGLVAIPDDGRAPYDRFRDRLMFPIHDAKGRVIAFGGRQMSDGQGAKYLNSPETAIFHKGATLYNLHRVKESRAKNAPLVVSEGYMDVIALHKAGFNAVAPLGTALTEDQIKLLWRQVPEPTLCFDGDAAGLRAAIRSAERVLPMLKPGYSLCYAFMPEGQDPDDLVQKGDEKTLRNLLLNPRNLLNTLWSHAVSMPATSPEQIALIKKQIQEWAHAIRDETIKSLYQKEWADLFYVTFVQKKTERSPQRGVSKPLRQRPNFSALYEKILLVTLVNHPHMIEEASDVLMELEFQDSDLVRLNDALLAFYGQGLELGHDTLVEYLDREGYRQILNDILSPNVLMHASFARKDAPKQQVSEGWKEILSRIKEKQGLGRDSRQLRGQLASDMTPETWERLKKIKELQNK